MKLQMRCPYVNKDYSNEPRVCLPRSKSHKEEIIRKSILKRNRENIAKKNVRLKNINKKGRTKNRGNNPNKKEKLQIMYVNANGISGKIQSLEDNIQETECNIICITETKLRNNPPTIEGYNWETKNRQNRQGGGVAILTRNNIQTTRVTDIEDNDHI